MTDESTEYPLLRIQGVDTPVLPEVKECHANSALKLKEGELYIRFVIPKGANFEYLSHALFWYRNTIAEELLLNIPNLVIVLNNGAILSFPGFENITPEAMLEEITQEAEFLRDVTKLRPW